MTASYLVMKDWRKDKVVLKDSGSKTDGKQVTQVVYWVTCAHISCAHPDLWLDCQAEFEAHSCGLTLMWCCN